MSKKAGKTKMTKDAARRIQSREARKRGDGTVPKGGFVARVMSAAEHNARESADSQK